jgi:hypothetical protein
VNKAVTVAEITKRRLRGLHQNTQIGLAPAAAATTAGASASSHPQPEISILLSLAPLDPSQPGYQPPLTDEEILNACVDDEPEQDCGDGATSGDAAASAAAFAPPPTGASSCASSGGAGPSAVQAAPEEAIAGSGIGTAAATAAADAAAGDEARSAVVFLDIDGVLLPFGEGVPACAADADPARSFPRHCLAALARLLEARSPPQPAP